MSTSKSNKNKDKNEKNALGLTYAEQKKIGHRSYSMSDIVWAGRLYAKYPYWNRRLTHIVCVSLLICCLSLFAMWISVIMRKPALLVGVYPNAEMLCFPRLRTSSGGESSTHNSYKDKCDELIRRVGRSWQVENAQLDASDRLAVGDISQNQQYKNIEQAVQDILTRKAQEKAAALSDERRRAVTSSSYYTDPNAPENIPGITPDITPDQSSNTTP